MTDNKAARPFGMRDKIGYMFGDTGCNFSFQLVSNYMYLFYTQCIGVSAADWAWIIIVSKIWDAVNDVLIGSMVDRTKPGKRSGSKFMPWISIGSVLLIVFSLMIFTPVNSFSYPLKVVWCLASYCLWSVAYTMINVPYGSLHSVLTEDPKGRTSLSTFRSIGAALPAMFIMVMPKVAYVDNKLDETRMFIICAVFSVLSFFAFFALRKMITERVARPASTEKINYLSTVKSFFTNRAMLGITIATFACVVCFNSTMSCNNLVFQFYFNDAGKAMYATIASYLPLIIFMPFASNLTLKIGKKKLLTVSGLISMAVGILMVFVPLSRDMKGIIVYVLGLVFINYGYCVFQIIVWAMVADCIEDNFRKRGVREEGSLYAIYSFFRKLAQGVGSAIVALALSAGGYIETATTQTDEAAKNIVKIYFIILAAGLCVVALSMMFIYNITKEDEQNFGRKAEETELKV